MQEKDSNASLEDHLKALFGYNDFRHSQKEIVTAILDRKDVVAILPTGAGKSICYQLPAMLHAGNCCCDLALDFADARSSR